MLNKIIRIFWPDLSDQEIKKFSLLSLAFFFTIGGYWLLRPLKDGFFFNVVGGDFQPRAKMLSVLVVGLLVVVYSKLVDIFEKHKLFYIIGSIYIVLFAFVAYVVGLPTVGPGAISPSLLRFMGWFSYLAIESFGSIVVALFWSFTASITDAASAKRGYSLIIGGAQIGAITGPFLAWNAEKLGMRLLFSIGTISVALLLVTIRYFMTTMPSSELAGGRQDVTTGKKPKTGFLEGIKLIVTRPYLFGIFAVVTIYEIVGTIVDYQMKMQARVLPEYASKEALTSFMGIFGMAANGLAFFMAVVGTAYFMKRFGLRFCLLTFPVTLGVAIIALFVAIQTGMASPRALLWMTFGVMMIAKGLSYALNNPSKEMMYIPTSRDAKFKSKGWIDMFGSRGSKATGSTFTEVLRHSPNLLMYGTILSLGLIGLWIVAAMFVSGAFNQLVKEGRIVE